MLLLPGTPPGHATGRAFAAGALPWEFAYGRSTGGDGDHSRRSRCGLLELEKMHSLPSVNSEG